jgi:hypothetical protein
VEDAVDEDRARRLSNSYFTGSPPTGTSMITLTLFGGSSPTGIQVDVHGARRLAATPAPSAGIGKARLLPRREQKC